MKKQIEELVITPDKIYGERKQFGEEALTKKFGQRFIDYRKKWIEAGNRKINISYPLYLQIEHSSTCNLRCPYCVQGILELKKEYLKGLPKLLSLERYQKILDESQKYNCPSLSFHMRNEPLLIKDIDKRIRMASDAGFIDLIMVTNGTVMDKEKADMILDSAITKINFSVDSIYPSVYNKIRIGGNVETVVNNIQYLIDEKKRCDLDLPIIRISSLVTKYNYDHVDYLKGYWKKCGADMVEFQTFRNWKGYTDDLEAPNTKPTTDFKCNQLWTKLSVRPNGDIMACCSEFTNDIKLGNIDTMSMYDAWHSKKREALVKNISIDNYACNPTCLDCSKAYVI